jgi:hypothetical protein
VLFSTPAWTNALLVSFEMLVPSSALPREATATLLM